MTADSLFRILVADDNADSAEALAIQLRLAGHEARTAADGAEACELAKEFRPHVALLDIEMPGLNGYDVARRIRTQPWGKHVFLVAVTGWDEAEDRKLSEEAGFSLHVTKPLDPDRLKSLLSSVPARPPGGIP